MTALPPSRRVAMLASALILSCIGASLFGIAGAQPYVQDEHAPRGTTDCSPLGVCPLEPLDASGMAKSDLSSSLAKPLVLLEFYWGVGCPHCEQAKPFLRELERRRTTVKVESVEVRQDPAGRKRFSSRMKQLGVSAVGVPTFVLGDRYVVGFTAGATEGDIERLVDHATQRGSEESGVPQPEEGVDTKLFGRLSAQRLGLPVFTVALGLLDGFNPCAMWVLVFLLAMLAGLRERKRMAITGATFVVASGLVYFAFMAAWLSVFLLIGMTRTVQVGLGVVALGIGVLNTKDFFAWKRGPSLSIPDSAKPGLYARIRSVLRQPTLTGSLVGVAILAVLVNLVELLCTAGLPAIYTSVLAKQNLSSWERLGYLGLYNLAYVTDDALMVTVAVVTLSRRRLAEKAGRWLKLLSGTVMLGLGLLLLLKPEWLP